MGIQIQLAEAESFSATVLIESRADELLIKYLGARDWPPATQAEERAAASGFTLLATDADTEEAVGFAQILEFDECAHLEQISVLPEVGRRGYGGLLIEAAVDEARERGHTFMTLRTFADVPWNAPFYAKHQFAVSAPASVLQLAMIDTEEALGLMAYGRRIQMSRAL